MKIFYGWRMVGAAACLQFLQAALLHQAFGAYFAVLNEERGWSKTALSGAAAIQSMESALLGPALGWIIDRFGPQGVIRAGVLTFGLGFIGLSLIDSLGGFYVAVVVIALGSSLCGYFPLNVAIINWFERKRARALSTVGLGLAVGGTAVPIVAWSLQVWGWRTTALASGVLAIVIGWPLARVFKRRPEDIGESLDGVADAALAEAAVADVSRSAAREFTAAEALRTRAFWLLAIGHGFALLVVTAVNVHAITHMKENLGYSVAQASFVITLMTMAQVGGVVAGWAVGDRFEKRWVAALCMVMHASGLVMLTFATGPAMLIAFAVLHGGAWGLRGPFMQAIRADYFGRRSIGMILGLSSLFIAIGQIGGPLVAGLLADLTGDYTLGFSVLAAVAASGALAFALATRPR